MNLIIKSLCAIAALCLFGACSSEPQNEAEDSVNYEVLVEVENNNVLADEVLEVLNLHRSTLGLEPLQWHDEPEDLALGHSVYMANRNEASHDNFFERSDFLRDRGATSVSENVAYGYTTAEDVVQGWLNSPSHKEAIESDFTHTGIGIIKNELGVNFYTQLFFK